MIGTTIRHDKVLEKLDQEGIKDEKETVASRSGAQSTNQAILEKPGLCIKCLLHRRNHPS